MMELPTNLSPYEKIVASDPGPVTVPFSWTATDQYAFTIEIAAGDVQGVTHKTISLAQAATSHDEVLDEALVGLSLKWRVRSWTEAEWNEAGGAAEVPWSAWSYFMVVRPGFLSIVEFAPSISPLLSLEFDPGSPSFNPHNQQVWVEEPDTGLVLARSERVPWPDTYQVPHAVLDADKEYVVKADALLEDGSTVYAERTFTTPGGIAPVLISDPDASTFAQDRTIRFSYWVESVDPDWVANYIYRRHLRIGAQWELLERSTTPFPGDGQPLNYEDQPPGNRPYEYSVRQAVDRG